ncbi:MAG: hypothetical protein ACRDCE_17705 [Cetobacterium sp.]|uniref:hypothetical protein n=1 Tax=Cetobacterium sp. TaxID=2071632 RepID=UPI003EE5E444
MKKVLAIILSATMLTGCAIPQSMKDNQKEEIKAIAAYHKAEKSAHRIGVANEKAKEIFMATTVAKAAADLDVKVKKKELDKILNESKD